MTPPKPVLGDSGLYFLTRAWIFALRLFRSLISFLRSVIFCWACLRAWSWASTSFWIWATFAALFWARWLTRVALLRRSDGFASARNVTVGSSPFVMYWFAASCATRPRASWRSRWRSLDLSSAFLAAYSASFSLARSPPYSLSSCSI